MADKTIDLLLRMNADTGDVTRDVNKATSALANMEKRANETRDKMEKLAQVGGKFAMLGAAITGPLLLAMQKFQSAAKDSGDVVSIRLGKAIERVDAAWGRIGRVVAQEVTPFLEKAADIVERIAAFAEENPGAIKAALGIGASLAVLGGIVATTAQIVSTIATVQGLAAGAGLISGGTAAAGTAAGVGAAGAGVAAALGPALAAAAPVIAGAVAVAIGTQFGFQLAGWLTGTEQNWETFSTNLALIASTAALGWDYIIAFFGGKSTLYESVAAATGLAAEKQIQADYLARRSEMQAENERQQNWLNFLGPIGAAVNSLVTLFAGVADLLGNLTGKAAGGYATYGAYMLGDSPHGGPGGAEFVLSAQSTRAAESIIGGRLSQDSVLGAMTTNINLANGMTVVQARRMIQSNNRRLVNALGW